MVSYKKSYSGVCKRKILKNVQTTLIHQYYSDSFKLLEVQFNLKVEMMLKYGDVCVRRPWLTVQIEIEF